MIKAVICDLDGTLCDDRHRKHLEVAAMHRFWATREPGEFHEYHRLLVNDPVHRAVLDILHALDRIGTHAIYLTSRPQMYQAITKAWLREWNAPLGTGMLLMRPDGVADRCWTRKAHTYRTHIQGAYDIQLAIDDNQRVIDMWHDLGIPAIKFTPPSTPPTQNPGKDLTHA